MPSPLFSAAANDKYITGTGVTSRRGDNRVEAGVAAPFVSRAPHYHLKVVTVMTRAVVVADPRGAAPCVSPPPPPPTVAHSLLGSSITPHW